MDDNLLQYLIAMGDLSPQEAQIARADTRAQALRGMAEPVMPQQGRVASRMPSNAWLPVLAGSIGGGLMQQHADTQRLDLEKKRTAAFQHMLQARQQQQPQLPKYPDGYGQNDDGVPQ